LTATRVFDEGYVTPAGTLSAMATVKAIDWLPAAFAATTVMVVDARILLKVPVITPVDAFNARPMLARLVAEAPETV
jgi:hypothetical protein